MVIALDDISSIKNIVVSSVYHAFILLCGHELKGGGDTDNCCGSAEESTDSAVRSSTSTSTSKNDDGCTDKEDSVNDEIMKIQKCRQELYQMVENTITVRRSGRQEDSRDSNPLERTKLYDIEIRTAMAYYQRYRDKSSSLLSITSDLGVTRTIHSPYQFAHDHLLPIIEQELQEHDISNHVRVATSSCFICGISHRLMTQIRRQQQQEQLQYPMEMDDHTNRNHDHHHRSKKLSPLVLHWESCPYCPLWCHGGNKGLWWHLQQQHSMLHHIATETATAQCSRNSTAIVVHNHDNNSSRRGLNNRHDNLFNGSNDNNVIDRCTGTGVDTVATTSTLSLEQPPQERFAVTSTVTNSFTPPQHHNIYSDPWECIQTSGTLPQFVQCLDQQPPSFDCCSARDKYGAVLLHWAAGNGKTSIVQYLIEQKQCPTNIQQLGKKGSFAGRTPLHWAARNGHYHTVLYILQYASQTSSTGTPLLDECIEAKTTDGTTPFCWASWQGHLNIMQLFYQYGCHVNTMNKYGCNAVLWVAQHPSSRGDDDDPSDAATANTRVVRVLQWLIEVGCDLLVVNHSGHGVLHKGAQRGSRDICEWYLNQLTRMIEQEEERDALTSDFIISILTVFGPNNDGCTASDLAGMENHLELAVYVAEQEQQFVGRLTKTFHSISSASFPKWLSPLPKGLLNRYDANQHNIWEPGAGVFRMRSVLREFR